MCVWRPIEHIFFPACLSVWKVHFFTFSWFWNSRFVISPKICPCILAFFPKYAPVSPFWLYRIQGHKRYRGIILNKVHIVQWSFWKGFLNSVPKTMPGTDLTLLVLPVFPSWFFIVHPALFTGDWQKCLLVILCSPVTSILANRAHANKERRG